MSPRRPSESDPLFLIVLRLVLAVVFVLAAITMIRHGEWRFGRGRGPGILIMRSQRPVCYWLGPILAVGGAAFLAGGPWLKRLWARVRRPPR